MITGQTIGNGLLDVMSLGTSATNQKTESQSAKQSDKVSFDQLLVNQTVSSKSLQNSNKTSTVTESMTTAKSSKNADKRQSASTTDSTLAKSKADNKAQTQKSEAATKPDQSSKAQKKSESEKTNQSEAVSETKDAAAADETTKAEDAMTVVSDQIKETIKDMLDLSDEELSKMMETLGLTMLDLQNPDALKQLIMLDAGTNDLMSFATDETLHQTFEALMDQISDITAQTQMTANVTQMPVTEEEFTSILDEALESMNPVDNKESEAAAQQTEDTKDETTASSNVSFTVVRQNDDGSEAKQSFQSDSGTNQQGMMTNTTQAEQFVNQIANQSVSTTGFEEHVSTIEQMREITNQIVEQIKVVIRPTQTAMEMTLNPENLGRVALHITSKAGVLTATFTAQSELAREAIESELSVLRENLENQGIKVDAIEVNVSDFSFENNNGMSQENSAQQEASRQKNRPFRMSEDDYGDELTKDTETEDILSGSSSVNYTA